jgi:riboflavin synthase
MFTGIISDIGRVRALQPAGDVRIEIDTAFDTGDIDIGASISCSGACLTVIDKGPGWFAVDASAETMARTNLGTWRERSRVNLERALKVGDELGGHIVTGHVDGLCEVVDKVEEGDSIRYQFQVPSEWAHYIAAKGSVTLDGVSLTVNEVENDRFGVNIIPHTQKMTTFGELEVGGKLNLEVDILARYIARLSQGVNV